MTVGLIAIIAASLIIGQNIGRQQVLNEYQPTVIAQATQVALLPSQYQFEVQGNQEWQDSSVSVKRGDVVAIMYISGRWTPTIQKTPSIDAGGYNTTYGSLDDIVTGANYGALLGKIEKGTPFLVGKNKAFIAEDSGNLFFRMNDLNVEDNDGSVIVQITVSRAHK